VQRESAQESDFFYRGELVEGKERKKRIVREIGTSNKTSWAKAMNPMGSCRKKRLPGSTGEVPEIRLCPPTLTVV